MRRQSRKDMVDYITGIGGYSRSLRERWPITFNVGTYYVDFSWENVWAFGIREFFSGQDLQDPEYIKQCEAEVRELYEEYQDKLWSYGVEDACDSVDNTDCYRTLPTGETAEASFVFEGRGGKHLCIEHFDRHGFIDKNPRDLYEEMMTQEGEDAEGYTEARSDMATLKRGWAWTFWTYDEIAKLYRFVKMWEECFNEKQASAEVTYLGIFCFWYNIVGSNLTCTREH